MGNASTKHTDAAKSKEKVARDSTQAEKVGLDSNPEKSGGEIAIEHDEDKDKDKDKIADRNPEDQRSVVKTDNVNVADVNTFNVGVVDEVSMPSTIVNSNKNTNIRVFDVGIAKIVSHDGSSDTGNDDIGADARNSELEAISKSVVFDTSSLVVGSSAERENKDTRNDYKQNVEDEPKQTYSIESNGLDRVQTHDDPINVKRVPNQPSAEKKKQENSAPLDIVEVMLRAFMDAKPVQSLVEVVVAAERQLSIVPLSYGSFAQDGSSSTMSSPVMPSPPKNILLSRARTVLQVALAENGDGESHKIEYAKAQISKLNPDILADDAIRRMDTKLEDRLLLKMSRRKLMRRRHKRWLNRIESGKTSSS